ncbi:MAG: hypothetical protein NTY39_01245 [Campylobacterales bacterium]|nr:hypothetical protein [Campylobacterales bacterium]
MSDKLKALIFGFTNAFTPIDYSQMNKLGDISNKIDRKMTTHRKFTRDKIDEITAQSNQSKSFRTASY